MIPIYVPSKGRWDTAKTPALLEAVAYPYYLVVEEQEYEQYKANFPNASLLSLPLSHQGIPYVRQWILEREYHSNGNWYWMVDDDMRAFYYREGNKITRADASVLEKSEPVLNAYEDVAQVGLHKKEYAWRSTKPFVWNNYCNGVVANNAQRVYPVAGYRQGVQEDIDMTLQVLSSGYRVIRIEQYFYDTPAFTGGGGLQEDYKRYEDHKWSKKMLELWGSDIIRLIQENGEHITVAPNWRYFSEKMIRKRLQEYV